MAVYRRILAVAPGQAKAWALLGLCATQAGEFDQAAEALARAARLAPHEPNIAFRLGVVEFQRSRLDAAEAAFRAALTLEPQHRDARQNLAATLVEQGRHAEARPLFEALLADHPRLELAWAGLAVVHGALGERAAMIAALERALALNPDNAATRHLLTAARGETPAHPDWRYVEQFFDDYAARFDAHLVDRLDYAAPERLADLIVRTAAAPAARALDLGCGTGLFGAALRRHWPGVALEGVDLSQRMLRAARARGLYAALEQAEIGDYLGRARPGFELVAAVDVFIYVGDLAGVFEGVARTLAPGGLFAFTVEPAVRAGFVLQTSGRYAHGADYLRALAARHGLGVRAELGAPLRRHGGTLEQGLYLVLDKSG